MYMQRPVTFLGVLLVFISLCVTAVRGQTAPSTSSQSESASTKLARWMELVNSPDLTAEKAAAFEELAVFGTPDIVPLLTPLLSDEKLAHYARFALEANPAPSVDEAFRQALDQLEGRLLIGVISSIGVRRDAQAIAPLADKLVQPDVHVAAAAAHALGSIATPEAADKLAASLATATGPQRAAIARGCVVCAENLNRGGATEKAVGLYDLVRAADVPPQIRLAGLRGAILARGVEGIPLMVEQLQADDVARVDVALRTARELPSEQVVPALIANLQGLRPATTGRVVLLLGDLGNTQAAAVVTEALASDAPDVRWAAIYSLGKIGDAQALAALWPLAVDPEASHAEAAREALTSLSGGAVDEAVTARLNSTEAASQLLALELIARRRITAAVPQVMQYATSGDPAIKSAAMAALGETVSLEQMPVLIQWVITARSDRDKAETQRALTAACVRMPDRDACARMLTEKLATAPPEAQTVLLEQLGALGGPVALACLADSAKDSSPETQDAATRILGTWIGSDVGPVLLDLARTIGNEKYKIRVLRGYIRIASQFGLPHDEKMEMCEKALAAAQRDEERDLVLDVLARDPSPIALRITMTQLDNKSLQEKAAAIAVAIAQTALQDDPQAVAEAMQRVMQAGVGADTKTRAQAYRDRAHDMQ
ncbi:MAG: HEAT repeat domain-containing protein [Pirellulaceae bacterium]